jgi:hypothetical protein
MVQEMESQLNEDNVREREERRTNEEAMLNMLENESEKIDNM